MFERATRLCRTSPQIATSRPLSAPRRRRIVAVDLLGEQLDRARIRVAHDQHVRVHGVQGHGRVDQGLALLDRRPGDRHVDDVGAQALGGQLEGGAGARRALEEQVDDRAPAKHIELLVGPPVDLDVAVGEVEQDADLGHRKALDAEEVAMLKAEALVGFRPGAH
jgi:hypothetical protein